MIDPYLKEGNSVQRLLGRMNREAKAAGVPARRIQLVVAIDRLLARLLVSAPKDYWVVKGGFANQLRRPDEARFTEDIDLRIASTIEAAPSLIAEAFGTDLADLLSYELASPPAPLEGPPRDLGSLSAVSFSALAFLPPLQPAQSGLARRQRRSWAVPRACCAARRSSRRPRWTWRGSSDRAVACVSGQA